MPRRKGPPSPRYRTVRMSGGRVRAEYGVWNHMIQRCHNPNSSGYKDYGARGIRVFQEWRDSFPAFFKAVGERPSPEHSLERKDNNLGYFPGNVEWATKKKQMANRRNTVFVDLDGESVPLAVAAKKTGVSIQTLRKRIASGMDLDDIDLFANVSRSGRVKLPGSSSYTTRSSHA